MTLPGNRAASTAFTMIELLVVIAILGILAALLFPVVGKMRAKGMETKSLSNLRQLGTMAQLYAGENNGALVPGKSGDTDVPAKQQWQVLLAPYASPNFAMNAGTGIWNVATEKGPTTKEMGVFWLERRFPTSLVPKTSYWQTGYGINMQPGRPDITMNNSREMGEGNPYWRGFSLLEIAKGPQRVLISEWPFWNMYINSGDINTVTTYANAQGGKLRAVFFDGHVGALSPQELMTAFLQN